MTLYNEIGYYRSIVEAPSRAKFNHHVMRFTNRVLMKLDLPKDVRAEFVSDIYELHAKKFSQPMSMNVVNTLSTFFMKDDTRGAIGGANKYAACSKLEYSFFSYKKEKRIRREDYFKESALDDVFANKIPTGKGISKESEAMMWLEELILNSYLTSEEEYILRANVVEGFTVRQIEEYSEGMSRATIGRRLKSAKDKLVDAQKRLERG